MITGGASGIGLATARELAAKGARLVLADIEQEPLDRAVAEFETAGVEVLGVRTDVGELSDVQALADAAWDRFGEVNILFNNAGVSVYGAIQDMTHADWEWSMRVNLWGVIHGVEIFIPRMIAQAGEGHVINTASFAGLVPNQGLGVYCVTKYGVVALSECLRRDVRAEGIGVSVLCPMIVKTNIGSSERNRPANMGGLEPSPKRSDEEKGNLRGGELEVETVAEMVVAGIESNKAYIITHPDSREFVRRRFDRIDDAFE